MSHPKIKNTITFTDEYAEKLTLSAKQINKIDDLTYNLFKNEMFSLDTNYDSRKERKRYHNKVLKTLDKNQRNTYNQLHEKRKHRNNSSDFETQRFNRHKEKYSTLKLDKVNLQQLWSILEGIRNRVSEETGIYNPKTKITNNKREFYLSLIATKLNGFLNTREKQAFYEIDKKEQDWLKEINKKQIKVEYDFIKIDDNQAFAIYQYQENEPWKNINKEYLSDFEKWEIEKEFMKSILSSDQLNKYLKLNKEHLDSHISHLKKDNFDELQEIARLESHLNYLIENYLPMLCKWRAEIENQLPDILKVEIEELRLDYQKGLKKHLNRNVKSHFRHAQNYMPNKAIRSKLETKLQFIVPSVYRISKETKSFLTKIPKVLVNHILKKNDKIKEANLKLHEFTITNYEKHGGTYGDWMYVHRPDKKEDRTEQEVLAILLLHPHLKKNISSMRILN